MQPVGGKCSPHLIIYLFANFAIFFGEQNNTVQRSERDKGRGEVARRARSKMNLQNSVRAHQGKRNSEQWEERKC